MGSLEKGMWDGGYHTSTPPPPSRFANHTQKQMLKISIYCTTVSRRRQESLQLRALVSQSLWLERVWMDTACMLAAQIRSVMTRKGSL